MDTPPKPGPGPTLKTILQTVGGLALLLAMAEAYGRIEHTGAIDFGSISGALETVGLYPGLVILFLFWWAPTFAVVVGVPMSIVAYLRARPQDDR